jgi:anti-sigma factor RsiW
MNINRHNYEEFFLLYADNELSAAGRREVEAFMEQHPDLAGELELFRQLKLEPEMPPAFEGKENLMRHEAELVSEEDAFLLAYLDNEMTGAEKKSAGQRIAADPRLTALLEQYRMAVLPADPIAFPDKSSLYRKEEQPARIVYMRWIRVAVAAAVILAGGLLWYNVSNQSTVASQQVAATDNGHPTPDTRHLTPDHQSAVASRQSAIQEQPNAAENAERTTQNAKQFATTAVTKSSPARNTDRGNEASTAVALNRPSEEQLATSKLQPATRNALASNNLPEVSSPVAANTVVDGGRPEIVDKPSVGTDTKSNYAAEALMNRTGTPDIMDDTEKSRKGPLRGLFRKANRFLNKAANPDPDKATVRVASFEIALGR